MKIAKTFEVDAPPDAVWEFLQDVPAVADCLPGAELTGTDGDDCFSGRVTVKLGPMTASFDGTASLRSDPIARSGRIVGTGKDRSGGSRGKLSMDYEVRPSTDGSIVDLAADVVLTGPVSQIGRQGLIDELASRLLDDFVHCVESRLDPARNGDAPVQTSEVRGLRLLFAGMLSMLRSFFGRLRRTSDDTHP